MASTHRLAVGTTNICKLKAVKSCQVKLAEHLSNYVISSHKVESGINDQPDSMSMTFVLGRCTETAAAGWD